MILKRVISLVTVLVAICLVSCNQGSRQRTPVTGPDSSATIEETAYPGENAQSVFALLVSPAKPVAGMPVRMLATGDKSIRKCRIEIEGPSSFQSQGRAKEGDGLPFWKMEEYTAGAPGNYKVKVLVKGEVVVQQEITVTPVAGPAVPSGLIWKSLQGWDASYEALYSAWINALFNEADERSSWAALHEVMQDRSRNLLYGHLGMDEDNPQAKVHVIMEPDCADNPFYLRAYFAWKLGLPFGYHETDRGWMGKAPSTGRWITNETPTSKGNPVLSFNAFLRRLMDGIHSGTARTAFANDQSDYYPVPLTHAALRPGVTFADPYGHTLVIVKWIPQSGNKPGMLLSVDAQPDGTVAVKRFWKGNFLFATTEVIGEPGFKAFRPIVSDGKSFKLVTNEQIREMQGLIPFSMEQRGMDPETFYHSMERQINPKPMDPETALNDLIQALHEQCLTRVLSVSNGEKYMQAHPGEIIPMPGKPSGVFLAGGSWEDYSTPNRDLRLLIAMDAVLDFPEKFMKTPEDYRVSAMTSVEQVKKKLESFIEKKTSELTITYTRSNGSEMTLTLAELLNRRDAFEMAYNPNDCVEIRWGAPENSEERSTCKRKVPQSQLERMKAVRPWFQKRLHPPT
jgi:hypothetical protein